MKSFLKIMSAAALVATSGVPVMAPANAHSTYYAHKHRYHGRTHYARKYCRHSSAATGKVAGGVAGAVIGSKVLGGGLLGAAAGAVGGVVAGGAIDRSMTARQRCYYRERLSGRMPAYAQHDRMTRPRERIYALAAVVVIQLALAFALLTGLRVDIRQSNQTVERLIALTLAKPPPPPIVAPKPRPESRPQAAPKAQPDKLGGSPGPQPARAPGAVAPVIPIKPTDAPSGGGSGAGPALGAGAGAGGGTGGSGIGAGDGGGSDLEQIAGEITPRDYPRHLREAGIGGVVGISFRVEPTGLVSRCTVTQSSGVPELDALTCRLIVQRFRYRPSTDRYGRPIADTVDGEHEWIPHGA